MNAATAVIRCSDRKASFNSSPYGYKAFLIGAAAIPEAAHVARKVIGEATTGIGAIKLLE
jgi:hypothetical protein